MIATFGIDLSNNLSPVCQYPFIPSTNQELLKLPPTHYMKNTLSFIALTLIPNILTVMSLYANSSDGFRYWNLLIALKLAASPVGVYTVPEYGERACGHFRKSNFRVIISVFAANQRLFSGSRITVARDQHDCPGATRCAVVCMSVAEYVQWTCQCDE